MDLDPDLAWYYGQGHEQNRLTRPGVGQLERLRTQELLERHLPPTGLILDVGGGPGAYAAWLARHGYQVELYDPVPLHIEQARAVARDQPDTPFQLFALEGFAAIVNDRDLAHWLADPGRAERLLSALKRVESEPSLLGATGHLLAVGRKS